MLQQLLWRKLHTWAAAAPCDAVAVNDAKGIGLHVLPESLKRNGFGKSGCSWSLQHCVSAPGNPGPATKGICKLR